MKRLLYFAFGSNLCLARLEARVGKVERIRTFVLPGHRLIFNCGFSKLNAFANIEPSNPNDRVEGVLYKLTERQISILDRYEGYPFNYEKFYLTDGDDIIFGYWAVSYIMPGVSKPALDYLNLIIHGCLENILMDTYAKLIDYKNQNYKLKKKALNKFKS